MLIRVSNRLYLDGFDPEYIQRLVEYCTLENSQYVWWLAKQGVTLSDEKMPEQFFVLGHADDCSFPVPLLPQILADWPTAKIKSELAKPRASFKIHEGYQPWPHQDRAVNRAKHVPWGIVVSGTGSGKTQMMMYLIAQLGYRALFVVPNVRLMDQAIADAREVFECDIGRLGDGSKTFGDLTVATVQTLYNMDLTTLRDTFGTVVYDEVDMFPMAWRKVLDAFAASHRYGDTATLKRGDGNHEVLNRLLGPVLYQVPSSELIAKGILIRPTTKWISTDYRVKKNYSADQRPFLLRELSRSAHRNQIIADSVRAELARGPVRILILSDLVDHVQALGDLLKDLRPVVYHGQLGDSKVCLNCGFSKPLEDRKVDCPQCGKNGAKLWKAKKAPKKTKDALQNAALEEIRNQTQGITIATYQSMGRGTNVPGWDRLVIGLPFMSRTRGSQVLGRIMRQYKGKEKAVVLDFEDDASTCTLITDMCLTRKEIYKEI